MAEKEKQVSEVQEETGKVMTKYDRKMQRRKQEEAKAKREQKIWSAIGIIFAAVVVILIASFPVRSLIAVKQAYIIVGGEKVTRVEYDYNYAMARNSYLNQYGSYLAMFGMTDTSSLDSQMYSDTLTFGDYFAQLAAENIQNTKALLAEADLEGFSYDTAGEYNEIKEQLTDAASEAGVTLNKYLKQNFGAYSTMSRLAPVIKETILTQAFYEQKCEELTPGDEEIQSYYEENKDSYDSVDYHLSIVSAELPTEAADGTVTYDEDGNEVAYEPTEEEIAAAMAEAKEQADALEADIAVSGEEYVNYSRAQVNSLLRDFLFDESRQPGDTTVVEDTTNNRYLVASFDARYLDETPTVKVRAILTSSVDAQTILDEWKSGEATEESFIEIAKIYDENDMEASDFLYEEIDPSEREGDMAEWLGSEERVFGDTAAFSTEDGTNYVFYYISTGDEVWKVNIRSVLLTETMNNYLDTVSENYPVEDPKGHLKYLAVSAAQAEAAAAAEAEVSAEEAADGDEEAGEAAEEN